MSTRDLSVKTGVLKRLVKEKSFYHAEKDSQQARIDKMVANEGDEYDIRKQREVLQETLDMIPDVERRRRAAREDLANIVTKVSAEVKATKEYEEATQVLENTE